MQAATLDAAAAAVVVGSFKNRNVAEVYLVL